MANLFGDDEPEFVDIVEAEPVEEEAEAEPVDLSPRANPDLFGHENIEKALLEDFNAGRLPHAIVLSGPSGIGKMTLACRLARFLLAGKSDRPDLLFVSPVSALFRRVVSGGHADLLIIEREIDEKKGRLKNDISIESVRRIAPFLRKTAAEGGWRVVIVDGAEYLNASSQNGLLKILEEPPKKAMLILTTTQPGLFLPTIRSRCRMIRMEPLADKIVLQLLDKMATGLSPDQKTTLGKLAAGSIGKALQYHQDGGLTLYNDLLKITARLPELDVVHAHELAEKIGRSEQAYDAARDIMTGWCATQAQAVARGNDLPRHFFTTWEKMSQLFLQTEIYNLDKRQAILSALLMLQKPDYQGLSVQA